MPEISIVSCDGSHHARLASCDRGVMVAIYQRGIAAPLWEDLLPCIVWHRAVNRIHDIVYPLRAESRFVWVRELNRVVDRLK